MSYQLEFPAPVISILYSAVVPQGFYSRKILQKYSGFHHPLSSHGGPGIKCHQLVSMELVFVISPGNMKLLSGIYQYSHTFVEKEKKKCEEESLIYHENLSPQCHSVLVP